MSNCSLCDSVGGFWLLEKNGWRVVRAQEENYPAFYRVISNSHMAEWSELSPEARAAGMDLVVGVEEVLRAQLQPRKINLASLGNVVPHLHWHIIARFDWDSHYPDPVWAQTRRSAATEKLQALQAQLPALDTAIGHAVLRLDALR